MSRTRVAAAAGVLLCAALSPGCSGPVAGLIGVTVEGLGAAAELSRQSAERAAVDRAAMKPLERAMTPEPVRAPATPPSPPSSPATP